MITDKTYSQVLIQMNSGWGSDGVNTSMVIWLDTFHYQRPPGKGGKYNGVTTALVSTQDHTQRGKGGGHLEIDASGYVVFIATLLGIALFQTLFPRSDWASEKIPKPRQVPLVAHYRESSSHQTAAGVRETPRAFRSRWLGRTIQSNPVFYPEAIPTRIPPSTVAGSMDPGSSQYLLPIIQTAVGESSNFLRQGESEESKQAMVISAQEAFDNRVVKAIKANDITGVVREMLKTKIYNKQIKADNEQIEVTKTVHPLGPLDPELKPAGYIPDISALSSEISSNTDKLTPDDLTKL